MSCSAFIQKTTGKRWLALTVAMMLSCASAWGQASSQPKQENPTSKKKAQAPAAAEKAPMGKKAEAAPAAELKTEAGEGDQDEPKGPWHGLTWRLVGPFRGGRVLAVSGV